MAAKKKRVVAVVGAFSFFGRAILRLLEHDDNYTRIVGIDVRPEPFHINKLETVRVDLTEPAADRRLREILSDNAVDTVVHLAYLSRPVHQQTWAHELETIGTMHVLSACERAQVKAVIALSNTMCYGALADNPVLLTEQHPLRGMGRSRWVTDKIDAERQLDRFAEENPKCSTTVLRLAPTFGPNIDNFWTQHFSQPVVQTLMGFDPMVQFLHEDDAINAFKLAIDQRPGETLNICATGVVPLLTAINLMQRRALPVPASFARGLSNTLWRAQLSRTPPGFWDYLRYRWVVSGRFAQQCLGFEALHSTAQIATAFGSTKRRFGLLPPVCHNKQAELRSS